jgi:hypothetical protein
MIKRIFDKLVAGVKKAVQFEPVTLAALGTLALVTFQSAVTDGLSIEDAAIAAIIATLLAAARQLSVPAVKVDAATGAFKAAVEEFEAEESLGEPYLGPDLT